MHPVDLTWAALALLGAAYPVYRLSSYRFRQSSRDFLAMVCIMALYPLCLLLYPHTPFDRGLMYGVLQFLAPLYFFSIVGYLDLQLPGYVWLRRGVFALTALVAVTALTNVWHGGFAEFQPPVAGQPNHIREWINPTPVMQLATLLSFVLTCATAVLAGVKLCLARTHWPQVLVAMVLPLFTTFSVFTSSDQPGPLEQAGISAFVLCTTLSLFAITFALARNHFVEVRVVTRNALIGRIPDAMVVVNRAGYVVDTNLAFDSLSGPRGGCAIGSLLAASWPEIASIIEQPDVLAAAEGPPQQLCLESADGARYFDVRIQTMGETPDRNEQIVLLRDVSDQTELTLELARSREELRAANADLQRLSMTDELTALGNRRYFDAELEQELVRFERHAEAFGLLSIDLDHFKRVNDEYGHSAGDEVLRVVARTMRAESRATDALARVGGEEFMLLVRTSDSRRLRVTAERIRQAIADEAILLNNDTVLHVTASVGGDLFQPGDSLAGLRERVDQALYRAKAMGRDRTVLGEEASPSGLREMRR